MLVRKPDSLRTGETCNPQREASPTVSRVMTFHGCRSKLPLAILIAILKTARMIRRAERLVYPLHGGFLNLPLRWWNFAQAALTLSDRGRPLQLPAFSQEFPHGHESEPASSQF